MKIHATYHICPFNRDVEAVKQVFEILKNTGVFDGRLVGHEIVYDCSLKNSTLEEFAGAVRHFVGEPLMKRIVILPNL